MGVKEIIEEMKFCSDNLEELAPKYCEAMKPVDELGDTIEAFELRYFELKQNLNDAIRGSDESVYFDKFECEGATIKCRKLPASVVVTDSDALSDSFVRVTTSPDKKAIKQALDAGEEVKGAELSPETYKLEVEV